MQAIYIYASYEYSFPTLVAVSRLILYLNSATEVIDLNHQIFPQTGQQNFPQYHEYGTA